MNHKDFELLSNSLTSYIGCNKYYRFVLCNKYYNLEIILRLEVSLNIERRVLLLWNPFNVVKRMEQLYDYFTG
jgi:hypothetical protein